MTIRWHRWAVILALGTSGVRADEIELPLPGRSLVDAPSWTCVAAADATICTRRDGAPATFTGMAVLGVRVTTRHGAIESSTALLSESDFDTVLGTLQQRWGPGEDHSENLRAGMGATFVNTVRVWRRPEGVWFAEQFAGSILRSGVSVQSPSAFEAESERRARATTNGARDL